MGWWVWKIDSRREIKDRVLRKWGVLLFPVIEVTGGERDIHEKWVPSISPLPGGQPDGGEKDLQVPGAHMRSPVRCVGD